MNKGDFYFIILFIVECCPDKHVHFHYCDMIKSLQYDTPVFYCYCCDFEYKNHDYHTAKNSLGRDHVSLLICILFCLSVICVLKVIVKIPITEHRHKF